MVTRQLVISSSNSTSSEETSVALIAELNFQVIEINQSEGQNTSSGYTTSTSIDGDDETKRFNEPIFAKIFKIDEQSNMSESSHNNISISDITISSKYSDEGQSWMSICTCNVGV